MEDVALTNQQPTQAITSDIKSIPAFSRILFSNCWEDTETEKAALRISENDTVLSITASGGRSLNLLEGKPKKLISIDLNASQSFLLEMKAASLQGFETYQEFSQFIGLVPSTTERLSSYSKVQPFLSKAAQQYWEGSKGQKYIQKGFLNSGRQDSLIKRVRPFFHIIVPRKKFEPLFTFDTLKDQVEYWDKTFNTKWFHNLAKFFFSKPFIWLLYNKDMYESTKHNSMGEMFFENLNIYAKHRLFKENYFLAHILTGRYTDVERINSYYLKKDNFLQAKQNVKALQVVTSPLEEYLHTLPDQSINKFSLSDIFDWVREENFQRIMKEVVRVATPNARLCYRICLVDRFPEPALQKHLIYEDSLSNDLFKVDRSCFYKGLWVGSIQK